ncbi:MAG: putative signal transducing protein [Planctomycetota bacterium]|jgi:hypothetical protein
MADKLITIATFADSIQASLAKQLLDSAGIKSLLAGQNAANIYTIPAVAATQLQVLESQAQQALEILKLNEKQEQ